MDSPAAVAPTIINISAYKFVALYDIDTLREALLAECQRLALKGTVLLAPEGINLFLAGTRPSIDGIVEWLRSDARFADLAPKESLSDHQPFRKMLVKKKREIITMNHPAIRPEGGRAPAVDAPTLKRWLDQGHDDDGREVLMVDTRNAFEVDYGAFENCLDWRIEKFSDFPAAARKHADQLAGKTVVTYCTGGIRCEKAVLVMQEAGIPDVLQLDGGILKYFEEVGGTHYRGECFVFDEREALDPALAPTDKPRR